jgi:8-oxo-dGTP diphosphatase
MVTRLMAAATGSVRRAGTVIAPATSTLSASGVHDSGTAAPGPSGPHTQPRVGVACSVFPVVRLPSGRSVVDTSHVALVKRGREPGKGLYCLPGGRLELGEPVAEAALRELREETGLSAPRVSVPPPSAAAGFTATDAIYKHQGKLSYHYAIVHVVAGVEASLDAATGAVVLPALAGGDDAEEAVWATFGDEPLDAVAEAEAGASRNGGGEGGGGGGQQRLLRLPRVEDFARDNVLVAASVDVLRLAQGAWRARGFGVLERRGGEESALR